MWPGSKCLATEKITSNSPEARVLDENEQERSRSTSALRWELCRNGDRTNEALLRRPSREPVRYASPPTVLSQRSLDRATWAKFGRRHRRYRGDRRRSASGIRHAIPGRPAAA